MMMNRAAPALAPGPGQGVFSAGPESVDSWTPGPKPLCHRHPTGPHPSGLLWTPWSPANGDSTSSNLALAVLGPRALRRRQLVAILGILPALEVGLALLREGRARFHQVVLVAMVVQRRGQ